MGTIGEPSGSSWNTPVGVRLPELRGRGEVYGFGSRAGISGGFVFVDCCWVEGLGEEWVLMVYRDMG